MKHVFVIEATINLAIEVEADSVDEAVAKAMAADVQSLCGQCSQSRPGVWCTDLEIGAPGDCKLMAYQPGGREVAIEAWEKAQ